MVGYAVSSNLMNLYTIAILDVCTQTLPYHWKKTMPKLSLQVAQFPEPEAMASPQFPQPDEGL